jgi:hypothetical protein
MKTDYEWTPSYLTCQHSNLQQYIGYLYVGFHVLIAVIIFWDTTPCSPFVANGRFGGYIPFRRLHDNISEKIILLINRLSLSGIRNLHFYRRLNEDYSNEIRLVIILCERQRFSWTVSMSVHAGVPLTRQPTHPSGENTVASSSAEDNALVFFFMISKFILQSVVIHLAERSVRLQWLGERHSVEPLHK